MSLLELLISLALSALLLLGLVQIASAAASSTRLQRNQAQLQENARLAITVITRFVREAGYSPEPWNPVRRLAGLTRDSADSLPGGGDRLAVRSWSDLNCFDNRNPELDALGQPAFYIREAMFDLNSGNGLTWQCRFGPSEADMVTQIRRQGFVQNVESFQVLFGEDTDGDTVIDRWVQAGGWETPDRVLGMRFGLLLASEDKVTEKDNREFRVLDTTFKKKADGRLRRVFEFAAAIRSRTG
jgi:type IV pilus assembly protein PilW